MNGVSLLLALATVGVDVGWESGPNSQLVYTVRIESVVLQKLRDGEAVRSPVELDDRGIRRFRIAMGPKAQVERAPHAVANEVQYGWRPSSENPREIDYFVQVLPERLETLAQGIPIECEVHPDVPEIHYVWFFPGNNELPRELPVGLQTPPPRTQSPDGAVRPAANSVTQPSNESRFGSDNSAARASVADAASPNTQRTYGSDRGWREETPSGPSNTSVYGPEPPSTYRRQQDSLVDDRNSRLRDDMIPVPGSRQPQYRYEDDRYHDDRYASRKEAARPPATNSNPSMYQGNQAQQASNDEVTKLLLERLDRQQEKLEKQQQDFLARQALPGYAAITPSTQPQLQQTENIAFDEGLRTPLVVTMLALFASLCANAYIGWLAWSFFWRFRNAASDLARAQTAATMRSAV
ncbi:MAG: hypothetical protein CMJ64_29375 [Planctomycetaceae bacterium]|nr:hypothetical protein [Planctomycetaceae bacterium]